MDKFYKHAKIKSIIRGFLSFAYYHLIYQQIRNKLEVTREGELLRPGISAVVVAKNEDTIIKKCLESLIGFADQIICIDNGSTDSTYAIMKLFLENNKDALDIKVISMPNSLLGDCREMGLQKTKHQWHLRWDADMVFKTTGEERSSVLKKKLMTCLKPIAFQLPRTNLFGDFNHTSRVKPVVDPGEPILVRFTKNIKYVEHGRFDIIKLPLYYRIVKDERKYYHHFDGLKPDLRLMYRNCYFDWREKCNKDIDNGLSDKLESFNIFEKKWQLNRYQTNDIKALKYRFQKEYLLQLKKYDVKIYGEYPEIIKELIYSDESRFQIEYSNNQPIRRIDKMDEEMINYQPTSDDLNYDPHVYLKKVLSTKEYKTIIE